MGRNTKYKSDSLCVAIFTLCLAARFVEYFLIETDRTAIGENVLHKAVGIIILALVLKRVNLTWSDIGFQRNGFVSSILKGLLLGSVCFAISYWLELTILALQGNPAHLEIYISSFSLTGSGIKNTDFVFFLLCVVFNVLNVWMEEGIFRGLFIKIFSESKSFMQANFIAAFLFGVWHIVSLWAWACWCPAAWPTRRASSSINPSGTICTLSGTCSCWRGASCNTPASPCTACSPRRPPPFAGSGEKPSPRSPCGGRTKQNLPGMQKARGLMDVHRPRALSIGAVSPRPPNFPDVPAAPSNRFCRAAAGAS